MIGMGRPGWYCVFCLVPLLNIIIFLFDITLTPGNAIKQSV
jgi:hypothetical protein